MSLTDLPSGEDGQGFVGDEADHEEGAQDEEDLLHGGSHVPLYTWGYGRSE